MQSSAPIGIFDSGIGGLTVAKAVKAAMPNEQLVYFGDLAHLPYGDKSTAAIQAYSVKITDFLLGQGCKVVLMACNSASASAFELVKEYAGSKAKVFNVIDPVIDQLREQHRNETIGLIGTKRTVDSRAYAHKVMQLPNELELKSLATPLLVPMIEEGFVENQISHDIISRYLSDPELHNISSLILGCTHYPIIEKEIVSFYAGKVKILNSAQIVAQALHGFLKYHNLLNRQVVQEDRFFVSDFTKSFEKTAELFFGQQVSLAFHKLWE